MSNNVATTYHATTPTPGKGGPDGRDGHGHTTQATDGVRFMDNSW